MEQLPLEAWVEPHHFTTPVVIPILKPVVEFNHDTFNEPTLPLLEQSEGL